MAETTTALLLIDADRAFARELASVAQARGYQATVAGSIDEAFQRKLLTFDVLVIDVRLAAREPESSGRLRTLAAEREVIVASDTSEQADIRGLEPASAWFVQKTDSGAVFAAIARAIERRQLVSRNDRLMWELRTINELAPVLTKSVDEVEDVLTGTLQRLMGAMQAIGGSIQLRDRLTGVYETEIVLGPPSVRRVLLGDCSTILQSSADVVEMRKVVIFDDLQEGLDISRELPVRGVIAVPIFARNEFLGTLTLASKTRGRFQALDREFLIIVAGQVAVAVQNAQLHYSIRRAKREWEQTVDAISDPIAVFNGQGELLRGNRALAAHLSLPVTAMRKLSCREIGLCGAEADAECSVTRALAQQEVRGEVTTTGGEIFSVTTFPIGTPSEGPSVVQVANNVTDEIKNARRLQQMSAELSASNERLLSALEQLKSAQTQLLQAEKLSAIGRLVAGVAHELNNPLTSVIGYAQIVEQELRHGLVERPANEVAEDLHRIADESERAARIVRNLLAFARRQTAARVSMDIVELCSRVLALRQYEFRINGIELRTDFAPELPRVLADGDQLQQVLLNLILNAEHAMRASAVRRLTIRTIHDAAARAIELVVSDSGHGIDETALPRIFDPFFTTKEVGEGTGLGLSICYGIIRDHGGHIRAQSQAGEGTTINITLPALSEDPSVRETQILIAHHEPGEREHLAAALGAWGYGTTTAGTLREALETCRLSTIDVAVVEGRMLAEDLPAWRAMAGASRRLPLVITSMPGEPAVARFCEQHAAAVLVTPISLRALREAVGTSTKEWV